MNDRRYVNIDRRGSVALLTLSRPEVLNAINTPLLDELEFAIAEVEADRNLRVVIITGDGERAFAAGGDVRAMRDMNLDEGRAFVTRGQSVLRGIESSRVAVIAAINGYALGGGTELALACDIRIASTRAVLGLPETTIGLLPGWGGTQRITRLIGPGYGREVVLTGRQIKAEEAKAMGLVNEVVEPHQLLERCYELAEAICANSPGAVQQAKAALVVGEALPVDSGLSFERECWLVNFGTADRVEGLSAFLEGRPAAWGEAQ